MRKTYAFGISKVDYSFLSQALVLAYPFSAQHLCKQYFKKRLSGKNTRKMGEKEIENFSLRVFIFFLKGK